MKTCPGMSKISVWISFQVSHFLGQEKAAHICDVRATKWCYCMYNMCDNVYTKYVWNVDKTFEMLILTHCGSIILYLLVGMCTIL